MLQRICRRSTLRQFPRCFSTVLTTPPPPQQDPSKQILAHALQHVNSSGYYLVNCATKSDRWSVESLGNGARDAGFPSVAHGMFPRGPIELVEFFMDDMQRQVQDKLAQETEDIPVTDRLKRGVRFRLQILAPYLRTWPQAMALGALPQNASTTMKKLAEMVDDIWVYAGDRSTDLSWAVLTGVYTATELFMLTDQSPSYEETWKFLDRRIEEAIALGDVPNNMQDVAGMMSIGLQSFMSTAAALAGPLAHQVASTVGQKLPNPLSLSAPSATHAATPTPPAAKAVTPAPSATRPVVLGKPYPEL